MSRGEQRDFLSSLPLIFDGFFQSLHHLCFFSPGGVDCVLSGEVLLNLSKSFDQGHKPEEKKKSMLMEAKDLLPCEFLFWHKASQKYGAHSFLPLASIQHTKKKKHVSDKRASTAIQELQ